MSHGMVGEFCPESIYAQQHLTFESTPHAVVDVKDRIVAMLAGAPEEKGWCCVVENATRELVEAGKAIYVAGKDPFQRGKFPTLAVGVSYGGGQKVCCPSLLAILSSPAAPGAHEFGSWAECVENPGISYSDSYPDTRF